MPQGTGTYGSKRGRPPKKKGGGGKILGSLSPLYGIATGEGAFGKLAKAGLSPAGMLAKKMKKNKQTPVAATAMAKTGGKVKKMKHGGGTCRGLGKAKRGGKYSRSG